MDSDDLEPLKKKPKPKDLDTMSIEDLSDYIADMEAEIARVRAKIGTKKSHAGAAAAFFKK